MLPKGSISQVIDYFVGHPNFAPALEEALLDYYEIESADELGVLQPSKMAQDFFNEWLVFDCELNSRRTVLQEYLSIHQDTLNRELKNLYSDLILTQHYSLFRIDEIQLDTGMLITDALEDKSYFITERKATREAVVGSYSFWRIAHVNNEWQIVSANGFQIPSEAILPRFIKDWKKRKIKFNPMVVYQQMLRPLEDGVV